MVKCFECGDRTNTTCFVCMIDVCPDSLYCSIKCIDCRKIHCYDCSFDQLGTCLFCSFARSNKI